MKVTLNNFLRMTPEAPGFSEKNTNYLVAGANPTYYTDTPGIQEQQLAPMAASFSWKKVAAVFDGNIIARCAASVYSGVYSVFVMTSTSQVYGVTYAGGVPTGVVSLGYPTGSALVGVTAGDMACVNGNLYVAMFGQTQVFKNSNFTTPAWTGFGSFSLGLSIFLCPFLEYCMIPVGSAVKKIDSSFSTNIGIDLGVGWIIVGVENYNDKYMAIAAVRANPYDYTENYLFLWDGISARYNYSMRIPGSYINMKMINGVLKVAVAEASNQTSVYNLRGTQLVPDFITPYSVIDNAEFGYVPQNADCLFNFKNMTGVRLKTNAELINPLFIRGKSPAGEKAFILSSGNIFSQFQLGTDGLLYAIEYVSGGVDNLYYYPIVNTAYQSLLYRSHWMSVDNAEGIDVYYDTPPNSGTDAINVTVFGRGQDIILGFYTIVLDPITPTTFLNKKRTRLDLKGFDGSDIMVQLSTVNTGTWRPIIRAIKVVTNE